MSNTNSTGVDSKQESLPGKDDAPADGVDARGIEKGGIEKGGTEKGGAEKSGIEKGGSQKSSSVNCLLYTSPSPRDS